MVFVTSSKIFRHGWQPCLRDGKLSQYIGETGRSLYSRGLEHGDNLRRGLKGQPLADHSRSSHQGAPLTTRDFKMELSTSHTKILPSLVSEGLQVAELLDKSKENPGQCTVLNSKTNFHQARLIKMVPQDQMTSSLQ